MFNDGKNLEFIIEKIDDALDNLAQFGSVEKLLNSKMGYDATLMCIMQIGETLKNKLSVGFVEKYGGILPIQESYWTRNYIAHDYEGVSKIVVEGLLREHLPKLKIDIENILVELQKEKGGAK
jgi:uncharacterized protein with HEPN domain